MAGFIIDITGTSPLLQHNVQLADPDNQWTLEIAKITSKRVKTADDRAEISRLEWYGGLYADNGRVVVPVMSFKKCISETAKVRKLGKATERAVLPLDGVFVPLQYPGPADIDKLYADPVYTLRNSVGVNGNRVQRTRPHFPEWSATFRVEVLPDAMDISTFIDLVHLAGRAEGIGDGRRIGYGRFSAVIEEEK